MVVLPQARDARSCSPLFPGLSPPGLSRRFELLPTNGRTCTPAHARNGGLRPLRLIPLDHSPPPHRAGTRRPPPRRGRDEYGGGWSEGDKLRSIPPFPVSPAQAGAHTGQGLKRFHGSRPSPGRRWISARPPFSPPREKVAAKRPDEGAPRRPRPSFPRSSSRKRGPRSFDAAAHRRDWRSQGQTPRCLSLCGPRRSPTLIAPAVNLGPRFREDERSDRGRASPLPSGRAQPFDLVQASVPDEPGWSRTSLRPAAARPRASAVLEQPGSPGDRLGKR